MLDTAHRLEKELAVLDRFEAVILDDIGYVQQSREEKEVLFEGRNRSVLTQPKGKPG